MSKLLSYEEQYAIHKSLSPSPKSPEAFKEIYDANRNKSEAYKIARIEHQKKQDEIDKEIKDEKNNPKLKKAKNVKPKPIQKAKLKIKPLELGERSYGITKNQLVSFGKMCIAAGKAETNKSDDSIMNEALKNLKGDEK